MAVRLSHAGSLLLLLKNKDDASETCGRHHVLAIPIIAAFSYCSQSEDLMDAYAAGLQLSGELKEIAAGLKADDNPVLMLIHFKK